MHNPSATMPRRWAQLGQSPACDPWLDFELLPAKSFLPMSPCCRAFLLLLPVLFVYGTQAFAQDKGSFASPSAACLAFNKGLSLGAPLPRTKTKLEAGQTLKIVALGSSSTTGFGILSAGGAFPDVMKQELVRLRPTARIELINSGRIMENIPDNIARLDNDVLRHKPDLVVWQLGSNDAVWRGIAENAKEMLTNAVKRLKAANADVILVDLQYAPLVLLTSRHIRMEKIISDVSREQRIGQFPRFVLMKRAIDGGVRGLVGLDGLHKSAEGHRCIGVALAQMIDDAVR
jgi:acyl-CoA thioesterase I